jgi:dihydroorotate dehydrogenase
MYQVLRKLLFLLPAEAAHSISMGFLRLVCRTAPGRWLVTRIYTVNDPLWRRNLFGLYFRNPVGLGAGFDKNARYLDALDALGFGFVEIGTVTPRPQSGNEKPRLFRLPADGALINRMGFNNDGVETVTRRLKTWRQLLEARAKKYHGKQPRLLVGGNIGKNKSTPNEEAWKDYEICFRTLHPFVDFFVVNVSSPNTPGLRALQEKEALREILTHLQDLNEQFDRKRPILLKIAPDLERAQLDDVLALAEEIGLDGLVAANTTISRDVLRTPEIKVQALGAGGLSGRPLRQKAVDLVQYIHQKTGGRLPLIGSGGIFTADDAQAQWEAGATLIEVWTGFIYEGPRIVKRIGLALDRRNN